jgi:hypothetical protein
MLWFQADGQRWPLEDMQFDWAGESDGLTRLTATAYGATATRTAYFGPAADPLNRADPSFDALDLELQDFFLYVARNSKDPSWRESVRLAWATGVRH